MQELQEAKKESTFNQMEFNKEVLRQLSVACAASQMLLGVASYNNEIKDMEKFKYSTMMKDVKLYSEEILAHFFPPEEDLSEE